MSEGDLTQLDARAWRAAIAELGEEAGYFEPLGRDHAVLFAEEAPRLLVSFTTFDAAREATGDGLPRAMSLLPGWSHLVLMSEGETWFRDRAVIGYFDRLVDDGFLEDFDEVVFFGAGAAGYAAGAFSVAAPGARVVLLEPQATLDPRVTGWDTRFRGERRRPFGPRYGYAPDMIEAAEEALIFFDPEHALDAMQASLFARANVRLKPLPYLAGNLEPALANMGALGPLLAGEARTDADIARLLRARRQHPRYLRGLLAKADLPGHEARAAAICRHAVRHVNVPRFRRRLQALEAEVREAAE